MKLPRLVLLALLTLWVSGQATPPARADSKESSTRRSLKPAFSVLELQNLDGETVALSTLLGKGPILVDFWATWCKPCLKALPELDALHTELGERGLSVLAINEDGPRNASKVKPFMQTNGYSFPVLLDLNREAQRRMQVATLPTTLLLDAEGNVLHTSFGYDPGEFTKLRPLIESLLPAKSAETDE